MSETKSEREVSKEIVDTFSHPASPVRLFRNTVGQVRLSNGQYIKYGLGRGTPDFIGWKKIQVTPDMVGKTVAVFVGLEVKRPGETPETHQQEFLDTLQQNGGIAGWADNPGTAMDILGLD